MNDNSIIRLNTIRYVFFPVVTLAAIKILLLACLLAGSSAPVLAQGGEEQVHKRGRIWETLRNDGWIGSLGAWDFLVSTPLGMYPGFEGYMHPVGSEFNAVDTYSNANYHNFRSGVWILGRNIIIPGAPPSFTPTTTKYEMYSSGLQDGGGAYGVETKREPSTLTKNYLGTPGFNPALPEEMISATWHTNLGITVTRRSYVWSFPGYRDFIIYDYTFKHTGEFVSVMTGAKVDNLSDQIRNQILSKLYFVFHSGISVSTKSQINFHNELTPVQAGAFGWQPAYYHDYFRLYDDNTLAFSLNVNGGKSPPSTDPGNMLKDPDEWTQRFGDELMSPAGFGWLALYASPVGTAPRTSPRPDILRIDSHKGGKFQGKNLDLEKFVVGSGSRKESFYAFAVTPDTQAALGNKGNRMNFYTFSYGSYTLQPGDSVRIMIAEIAGVMDYNEVNAGDPDQHFPEGTIAAVRQNAEYARNAVRWGMGATVDGIPLAADVPEPPPAPQCDAVNASLGTNKAVISVTWDLSAESSMVYDSRGNLFYNGVNDLDGYRVYRSADFQYTSATEPPVFRGAAWTRVADIPRASWSQYFDNSLGKYRFSDSTVRFGFKYAYYVSGYSSTPNPWRSANDSLVLDLPELESGDYNRSIPTAAAPGPVSSFDIFVAPNPYVYNDPARSFGMTDPYKVEFRNLPERCIIRIYSVMGDLVRQLQHEPDSRGNVYGSEPWDQKSDSGLLVAPGVYLYHVESTTPGLEDTKMGRLTIVR